MTSDPSQTILYYTMYCLLLAYGFTYKFHPLTLLYYHDKICTTLGDDNPIKVQTLPPFRLTLLRCKNY